jgi:RsiW-degrading membrane proteinase PrsW (M82 family)/CRP-like cAMP-binding protein
MNISLVISYLIAILVPLFAIYLIVFLDLFATGKRSTILISFAWGAIGAFGLAYVANTSIRDVVGYTTVVTLTAPIVEEILKSLVLVYFIQQPRFRYIVDGAIYGFAVGIGFAVTENVFYLSNNPGAGLTLALSRVLSTTLMHATASATVGIALGHLRRSRASTKLLWSLLGIALAITLHVVYNNLVGQLTGTMLLLVAVGIGIGGGAVIAFLINQGLSEEKKRFEETLGLDVGVSSGERKAVQQLGGDAIEKVLYELGAFFGTDKVEKIRRLLVIQANMGILQNNLRSPVSERLRKAWEDESATLRAETDRIRHDLGLYVMSFLRGVFPPEESANSPFNRALSRSDPTVIHTFDIFMTASKLAGSIAPEELEATAELLKKVEFFKEVSLADLENLSRAIVPRTYSHGDLLFKEGDEGDALYLIQQGGIDLLTAVGAEERLLRTMQVGDMVGELALLDGQPRSAKARANGSLTVLMLRREQFMMFLTSRPQVILAVLQYLTRRVRHVTEIVETSISAARKVAEGDDEQARTAGAMIPSEASHAAQSAQPSTQQPTQTPATPESSPTDAPMSVGGAFAMVASALEQRDQDVQKKLADTGMMSEDMSELPASHQDVLKIVMQDQIASAQGITVELLQAKLTHIEGVADIVVELTRTEWLITVEATPHVRYKANPKRKRAKQVSLFKNAGKAGG